MAFRYFTEERQREQATQKHLFGHLKGPTLANLPFPTMAEGLQFDTTVRAAKEGMGAGMLLLERILNAPYGYPNLLRHELNKIRFHNMSALSQIDSYLNAGNLYSDSANFVPGLDLAVDNYLRAIRKAKTVWNAWLDAEKQERREVTVLKPASPSLVPTKVVTTTAPVLTPATAVPVPTPTPAVTGTAPAPVGDVDIVTAAKPPTIWTGIATIGVGLAVILAIRAMK